MVTSIFLKCLGDLNGIKSSTKFFRNIKRKIIINKMTKYIQKKYLLDGKFGANHIIDFCMMFYAAKANNIFKNNIYIQDNHIDISGIGMDIFYSADLSSIKIKTNNNELTYIAVPDSDIQLKYIDIRDSDHSYSYIYSYALLSHNKPERYNTRERILMSNSFDMLYIAFHLILQLVANGMYEKEN